MEEGTIILDDGLHLVKPTEEALEYIEQNFREGDAMEHDFFGGSLKCPEGQPSWVVMHDDKIIGVCGFTFASDGGMLSDCRVVWFLSTTVCDREKLFFVKHSRAVFRAIVNTLPKWVRCIITVPMADYKMAVKWDKRILGFHERRRIIHDGAEFVVMSIAREEV